MALRTQIIDAGTDHPRKMPNGWGWWHLECMAATITDETGVAGFWSALSECPYIVKSEHTFTDPADGEVLIFSPGDRLDAWRDR